MDQWTERAEHWGIELGYFDVHGRRHEAQPRALNAVVEALEAAGLSPSRLDQDTAQPQPAYQGDGRRVWLLAVQLYAVRSRRGWGLGDFGDLARLLEIVADAGGAGVGLNPLHALFYDRAGTGSPYSPSSRLFLNPIYIDVEAVEEFRPRHAAKFKAEIERLRSAELIDYAAVAKLKLAVLRAVHRDFVRRGRAARHRDFEDYRRERGEDLEAFASFETLRGLFPDPWPIWPAEWRKPDAETLRRLRDDHADKIEFHEFLQWNAERQLRRCADIAKRRGLSIGLYLDTALGIDPGGADAWMQQDAYLRGLSVGAPPDQYNPAGQDWGLTAYHPQALLTDRFEPFRKVLRAVMRHSGAIRIDHVLGLMRLFVIPRDMPSRDGVYLRFPFTAMLAAVAEESRHWHCIVIGEDLGTVPEDFRAVLSSWGVWSYLVLLFERSGDGAFRRATDYPEMAIATFGTHDLPTFAGWNNGEDLRSKRAIGVDPGETEEEREGARTALRAAVGSDAALRYQDVVAFLAATPTRLVSISIEDVLEMTEQVNMPGTIDQHPNWRRRWPITVEDLAADPRLRKVTDIMAQAERGSP